MVRKTVDTRFSLFPKSGIGRFLGSRRARVPIKAHRRPRTSPRLEALQSRVMMAVDISDSLSAGLPETPSILFIRGGAGTGGFLEGGSDEQLADINNDGTGNRNHGWGQLATAIENAGLDLTQIIEGPGTGGNGSPVPLSTMNLDQYEVIVFGSNNAVYTQADIDAFEQYVVDGGAALFISDANFGSDWADAPNSDQQFLDLFGIEVHQDQGTYVVGNAAGEIIQPNHPIFAGVSQFKGEGVSPFHVAQVVPGVEVTLLAGAEGNTRLNQPPFGIRNRGPSVATTGDDVSVITATLGKGRIVGHYDRNTFFNTNGAGTDITEFDNQQYAVNLFSWLAETRFIPHVDDVTINDGSVQRSSVTSVTVTFDTLVDAPAGAFSLTNLGTSAVPQDVPLTGLQVEVDDSSGQSVVTISLASGASLPDGNYRLDITASQITGAAGGPAMAADYSFGDEPADDFFRLYGDATGDGITNFDDFNYHFLPAFGTSLGQPGYRAYLDLDDDGNVNFPDFNDGFLPNFGASR